MKVYFYGCISLDGYLADAAHGLDWLEQTGMVEQTGYDAFYRQIDVTLMGRRTFDAIVRSGQAAEAYPTTRNYVFTHADSLPVEGYEPVQGDVAAFVRQLPSDAAVWVVGGNTLVAPLLACGLIDCIVLQIAPVLLGAGIPLFTQPPARQQFRLTAMRQYGPFAELVYERAV